MARLDPNMVSVERSSFCSDNCRYDRSGRGSEPPAANPHPDRWLYLDADGDAVLYDDPGAGVVSRIWMTTGGPESACFNPAQHLKLYLGQGSTAALDLPLGQVFDGSSAPFTPPLVFDKDQGSGGYASYVPIAYAHGLRVAVSGLDQPGPCSGNVAPLLWYQIDAQRLPPGSVNSDFSVADSHNPLRNFLGAEGADPWQRGLPASSASAVLAPGHSLSLATDNGSGWLAGVRLKLDSASWSSVRLKVDIDGQPAMDLPLSQAFAVDRLDTAPARSPLFGLDAAGWLYLWWPMPYRQQLALTLDGAALSQAVSVHSAVVLDPAPVPVVSGTLHALARQQCGSGSNNQLELARATGSGRLVGLTGSYAAAASNDARYLEGDVRVVMDGQVAPQWPGSGLEDFFNGGFYFDWGRAYAQHLSGAGSVDVHGQSRMWRLLLGDAAAFANRVSLWQEAGASPAEPVPMCTDTVAWLYQSPARNLVPVMTLQAGSARDTMRFQHQLPPATNCASVSSRFADAAASVRSRIVCRFSSGSEQFQVHLANPSQVLRLRRTLDAATPGQAARIEVNGATAGFFSPVRPDSVRRWQTQDAPLAVPAGSTVLQISVIPLWGAHGDGGSFTASRYELWGTPGDHIFESGFESMSSDGALQ